MEVIPEFGSSSSSELKSPDENLESKNETISTFSNNSSSLYLVVKHEKMHHMHGIIFVVCTLKKKKTSKSKKIVGILRSCIKKYFNLKIVQFKLRWN